MNAHEVYHRILIHLARQIREGKNWPREKLVTAIMSECLLEEKENQGLRHKVEKQLNYLLAEDRKEPNPPLIEIIEGMCEECYEDHHPCTEECPTGAISCAEGIHHINYDLCIECGRCINACISGAIVTRSEFAQVARMLINNDKVPVYGILAPSFVGQFGPKVTPSILKGALRSMGFTEIYEVALAADITTMYEAEEFCQRMEQGEKFMITSCCCPAFIKFIEKIRPKVANLVSPTVSPMIALGKMLKIREKDCQVVFIGPCIAKKNEAKRPDLQPSIDCVLTYKETQALLEAANIPLDGSLGSLEMEDASHHGRIYAYTGGVTEAIVECIRHHRKNVTLIPVKGNGLKECGTLLEKIEQGQVKANFMEGMGCPGGCVGGPGTLIESSEGALYANKFARRSDYYSPHDNPTAHQWMEDYYQVADTYSNKISMSNTIGTNFSRSEQKDEQLF